MSAEQVSFVKTYHDMAVKLAIEFGIPWEDVLAQGINESASGTSNFAKNRNNFFGIGAYTNNPDHAYYYATARDGFIGMFQNFITTTAVPSYIDQGAFNANGPHGNSVTDPNAFLLSIAKTYTGEYYIELIAPLISGIQKLSEKEGWESSAQLATSHPEMLSNAETIRTTKKTPYKSYGNGTSTNPYRYEYKGESNSSLPSDVCGTKGGNGDINSTAIALSWPEEQTGSWQNQPVVPEYAKALKEVGLSSGVGDACSQAGASCDAFVATVMRYSGVDKDFYCCGAAAVLNYLKSNPDKYEEIPNKGNTSNLQPGDIRSRSGHVELIVKLDNGEFRIASASHCDRQSDHAGGFYANSEYKIFRHK